MPPWFQSRLFSCATIRSTTAGFLSIVWVVYASNRDGSRIQAIDLPGTRQWYRASRLPGVVGGYSRVCHQIVIEHTLLPLVQPRSVPSKGFIFKWTLEVASIGVLLVHAPKALENGGIFILSLFCRRTGLAK